MLACIAFSIFGVFISFIITKEDYNSKNTDTTNNMQYFTKTRTFSPGKKACIFNCFPAAFLQFVLLHLQILQLYLFVLGKRPSGPASVVHLVKVGVVLFLRIPAVRGTGDAGGAGPVPRTAGGDCPAAGAPVTGNTVSGAAGTARAGEQPCQEAEGDHYVGDISYKSVLEAFAGEVIRESGSIDYLVNNAIFKCILSR